MSFGALLGLSNLGISYGEVPPGKSGCPFHNHHVEEELFVILEGEGQYRFGADRHAVKAGDVLGAPAGGPETAHCLINTGLTPLKYLSISANARTEICEYPDSGKFLAKTRDPAGRPQFRFIDALILLSIIGRENPEPEPSSSTFSNQRNEQPACTPSPRSKPTA